ncbi:MAG: hypothetical protein IPJ01_10050 [Micavibrio sp.]|nr:hypothetical protein [Micavibrio sp.]
MKKVEQNIKETVSTMESVLFTDITEKTIKSKSPLAYSELLDLLAFENNIKARFTPNFVFGKLSDIEKAQDLLIKSIKYN